METGAIVIEESGDLIDPMEVDSQGNIIYCDVEREINFLLERENENVEKKKGQTGSSPPLPSASLLSNHHCCPRKRRGTTSSKGTS